MCMSWNIKEIHKIHFIHTELIRSVMQIDRHVDCYSWTLIVTGVIGGVPKV
jgi:hypothetical protein